MPNLQQNLPSPPPRYDTRDQAETRRTIESSFASLSREFNVLQRRLEALERNAGTYAPSMASTDARSTSTGDPVPVTTS